MGDTCDRLEECRALGRGVSTGRCEEIFNDALNETDAFDVRHVRVIEIGGLYPRVFVLGHP